MTTKISGYAAAEAAFFNELAAIETGHKNARDEAHVQIADPAARLVAAGLVSGLEEAAKARARGRYYARLERLKNTHKLGAQSGIF